MAIHALVGKSAPGISRKVCLVCTNGFICVGHVAIQIARWCGIFAIAVTKVTGFRSACRLVTGKTVFLRSPVSGIIRTVATLAGTDIPTQIFRDIIRMEIAGI